MEGGGGEGILVVFPLSLMSLSTLVNISESCKELYNMWGGAAGWYTVRYTYRAENDSHFGAGVLLFFHHYLPWFNGTGEDKGDGLNTEGRVGKKIKKDRRFKSCSLDRDEAILWSFLMYLEDHCKDFDYYVIFNRITSIILKHIIVQLRRLRKVIKKTGRNVNSQIYCHRNN